MSRIEQSFLNAIKSSFEIFIKSGTSRSNKKLKPLHSAIAKDILHTLQKDKKHGKSFSVMSLGIDDDKEGKISGKYMDKKVDITISCDDKTVGGIAVKFVMQNYFQNSGNYFENMLGETANIRSKNIPYFQIFIVPDCLPYYDKEDNITKWESLETNPEYIKKYALLSRDKVEECFHSPNKTLFYMIHISSAKRTIQNKKDYLNYYKTNVFRLTKSRANPPKFGSAVIYNDYEKFLHNAFHTILREIL